MNKSVYQKIQLITLILILLVVSAGSIVRATGSGMGCPDWPKCFGRWIPPTDVSELPEDYKEIYLAKREKKLNRFGAFLEKLGMSETAERLQNDPEVLIEQDFNARHTWTEYLNRLVGALSGIFVFFSFIGAFFLKNRPKRLLLLTFSILILMGIEGWLGSIVVVTNLTTWTISIHMWLALLIILLHIRAMWLTRSSNVAIDLPNNYKWLSRGLFAFLLVQIILGTEVRTQVDEFMVIDNIIEQFGVGYFIHRSFSWVILFSVIGLFYLNRKHHLGIRSVFSIAIVTGVIILSGILMSYLDLPRWNQPIHLLGSSILLSIVTWHLFFTERKKPSKSFLR